MAPTYQVDSGDTALHHSCCSAIYCIGSGSSRMDRNPIHRKTTPGNSQIPGWRKPLVAPSTGVRIPIDHRQVPAVLAGLVLSSKPKPRIAQKRLVLQIRSSIDRFLRPAKPNR